MKNTSVAFFLLIALSITILIGNYPNLLFVIFFASILGIPAWKHFSDDIKVDENKDNKKQASNLTSDKRLKPEEMVVNYVFDILIDDYGFDESDIALEFPIQMGSSSKRADIVVFNHKMLHRQENIYIIIECKRADRSYKQNHISQLHSYMSACVNVRFGILASSEWRVWDKVRTHAGFEFDECEDIPDVSNDFIDLMYSPPTPM